jgi:hypothetical protein
VRARCFCRSRCWYRSSYRRAGRLRLVVSWVGSTKVSVLSLGNKVKVDAECDLACIYYLSFTQRSFSFIRTASLTLDGQRKYSSSEQCSAMASTTSSPRQEQK